MISIFSETAKKVETTVYEVKRSTKAIDKVLTYIIGSESSVVMSDFSFVPQELLKEYINKNQNIKINPTDKELKEAKYGITDSFAGIAETASVCILNDTSMSGSFSLFPNIHIAILDSKNIVARPRDIFLTEPYKTITADKDFIIVSGSSATADMGPLVRGVHGPEKLYVLIIK